MDSAELLRLGWRVCPSCSKRRDVDDLFPLEEQTCLLCQHRPASIAAGKERRAAQQTRVQASRPRLSPEERYRRQLEGAGYMPEQVERYVARKFGCAT